MARVSVVIPTFNRFGVLCRAVESVLKQSFSNVEIIVVDDGSTDETPETFLKLFPQVTYHYIPHSGLPAVARNAGLRIATAEYVAFLDSDDQWLPGKLAQQIEALERNHAVGLVCSNAFVIHQDDEIPIQPYLQWYQGQSGRVLNALLENNFVIASTAVVRRSILSQVGFFGEEPMLRFGEDYDLWLRMASTSEIHYISKALAVYRDDPSISIRRNVTIAITCEARLFALKRLRQFLKTTGAADPASVELLRTHEVTALKKCCEVLWANRQYGTFLRYAQQLFVWSPWIVGIAILKRIGRAISRRVVMLYKH